MPATARTHIRVDEQGAAWIKGTTMRVVQVALDKITRMLGCG